MDETCPLCTGGRGGGGGGLLSLHEGGAALLLAPGQQMPALVHQVRWRSIGARGARRGLRGKAQLHLLRRARHAVVLQPLRHVPGRPRSQEWLQGSRLGEAMSLDGARRGNGGQRAGGAGGGRADPWLVCVTQWLDRAVERGGPAILARVWSVCARARGGGALSGCRARRGTEASSGARKKSRGGGKDFEMAGGTRRVRLVRGEGRGVST